MSNFFVWLWCHCDQLTYCDHYLFVCRLYYLSKSHNAQQLIGTEGFSLERVYVAHFSLKLIDIYEAVFLK